MITEDYVSFEIAKLLKEKGFDEQCTYMYDSQHNLYSTFEQCRQVTRNNSDWVHYVGQLNIVPIAVPTLQTAMKWLRKVHKLFINIDVIREASCWTANIQDIGNDVDRWVVEKDFKSYEEAVEGAIEYCLINLI